jgi:deoxycytidylate deaminase
MAVKYDRDQLLSDLSNEVMGCPNEYGLEDSVEYCDKGPCEECKAAALDSVLVPTGGD